MYIPHIRMCISIVDSYPRGASVVLGCGARGGCVLFQIDDRESLTSFHFDRKVTKLAVSRNPF